MREGIGGHVYVDQKKKGEVICLFIHIKVNWLISLGVVFTLIRKERLGSTFLDKDIGNCYEVSLYLIKLMMSFFCPYTTAVSLLKYSISLFWFVEK